MGTHARDKAWASRLDLILMGAPSLGRAVLTRAAQVCGEHSLSHPLLADSQRSTSGRVYHQRPQIVWRMNQPQSSTPSTPALEQRS